MIIITTSERCCVSKRFDDCKYDYRLDRDAAWEYASMIIIITSESS